MNEAQAEEWTDGEVIHRWHRLCIKALLSQRYMQGNKQTKAELDILQEQVATWRERLLDISWFMRVLNEGIARQANKEDQCTGRFCAPVFSSCKTGIPYVLYLREDRLSGIIR